MRRTARQERSADENANHRGTVAGARGFVGRRRIHAVGGMGTNRDIPSSPREPAVSAFASRNRTRQLPGELARLSDAGHSDIRGFAPRDLARQGPRLCNSKSHRTNRLRPHYQRIPRARIGSPRQPDSCSSGINQTSESAVRDSTLARISVASRSERTDQL